MSVLNGILKTVKMTRLKPKLKTAGYLGVSALALTGLIVSSGDAAAIDHRLPPPRNAPIISDKCISHRGNIDSRSHTEETSAAYRQSIAAGARIEDGDIRWTESGYPMMLHSATMGVFGEPSIKLNTLSVAKAKSYESNSGDSIASLYDIRVIAQSFESIQWQLELKEEPANWDLLDSRLAGLKDRVMLSSFSLVRVREAQDHGYRTLLLTADDTDVTAAPVVGQDLSTVDAAHVAALRSVGVLTYVYTPDNEAGWSQAFTAGASKVWTNKPEACTEWVVNNL